MTDTEKMHILIAEIKRCIDDDRKVRAVDKLSYLDDMLSLLPASASPGSGEGWQPKVGDRVHYILEPAPRYGRPSEMREPATVTRVNGVHITVKVDRWPRKRTTSPRYLSALPASEGQDTI